MEKRIERRELDDIFDDGDVDEVEESGLSVGGKEGERRTGGRQEDTCHLSLLSPCDETVSLDCIKMERYGEEGAPGGIYVLYPRNKDEEDREGREGKGRKGEEKGSKGIESTGIEEDVLFEC